MCHVDPVIGGVKIEPLFIIKNFPYLILNSRFHKIKNM